jgi:hypothetical protein
MSSLSYQQFIDDLHLESDKINWKLFGFFCLSLLTQLPATTAFIHNLASLDLNTYLSSSSLASLVDFRPALSSISNYLNANLLITVSVIFVLNLASQLYVMVYIARIIRWLARQRQIIFAHYPVYNSLLLVYAVKTLSDVLIIGLLFRPLLVGQESVVQYIVLIENIAVYIWLYFLLQNFRPITKSKTIAG